MMPKRVQITVLAVLGAILLVVLWWNLRGPAAAPAASVSGETRYQPISVENLTLRLDLLERIRKDDYSGVHRNIFSSAPPPPPASSGTAEPPKSLGAGPQMEPAPPPLQVPATFFGFATDPLSGRRRAFFTDGDDVFIVGEGETLLMRFRVLRIGNNTAEVEEIASGRRTTLVMEEPGPSA